MVDTNRDYAQVVAETDNSNQINVEYTFGDDLISQTRNSQQFNYLYDAQGTTRALADDTGNITDSYFYDAFGNTLANTGTTENNFLYTGEQFDASLNQYYLRARYYHQGVGRFTQMDEWQGKLCTPITLNKYIYADSEAVNGIDPSGYFTISGLMQSVNVQASLRSSTVRTFVFGKGKKSAVKEFACRLGAAYMKNGIAKDAAKTGSFKVEAHHPINKSFLSKGANNRRPRQSLLRLPSDTHSMYHRVLNLLLQAETRNHFGGLDNYSKGSSWQRHFELHPQARKNLYLRIRVAAKVVDNLCELKFPNNIDSFVRKHKKKFLGQR